MMGEGSQKLEPWSSLHDFWAAQQVRDSLRQVGCLSSHHCLHNPEEGGAMQIWLVSGISETCELFASGVSLYKPSFGTFQVLRSFPPGQIEDTAGWVGLLSTHQEACSTRF